MADNVVAFDFGKRKPKTVQAVPSARDEPTEDEVSDDYKHMSPLMGKALLRAQMDLVYMLEKGDFVNKMRDKLKRAEDVIFSLKDYVADQNSIRLRRQGLKGSSLEEICKAVDETHELQWRKQPSYLGALTLEYHYRVQAALSIMQSQEAET